MQLLPLLLVRSFRPPSHQRRSSITAPRQQQQQQQQPVTAVVLCAVGVGGGLGSGSGSGAWPSGASRTSANSAVAASRYGPTADNLNHRGIRAAEAACDRGWDDPDRCRRAVQHFFETLLECPDREAAGADEEAEADNELLDERRGVPAAAAEGGTVGTCYARLVSVWDPPYDSESQFNVALFRAVGESIQEAVARAPLRTPFRDVVITPTAIVLVPKETVEAAADGGGGGGGGGGNGEATRGATVEYATGLAREATLAPDRSCILSRSARPDHAWVVFQRSRGGGSDADWTVSSALAVVDLKVRGIRQFRTTPEGNVDVEDHDPLKADDYGPLAQVIMYTAAHALRGTALLGRLPDRIPFAVVACKKANDAEAEAEMGWVHGYLVVPPVCGFPYTFSVDAFGTVREGAGENCASLAAYLHVMTHGLAGAMRWLEAMPGTTDRVAPHCICGRALHFGTDMPLVGSAHVVAPLRLVATPVSNPLHDGCSISQGLLSTSHPFGTLAQLTIVWSGFSTPTTTRSTRSCSRRPPCPLSTF
jgi:hypothetical protein